MPLQGLDQILNILNIECFISVRYAYAAKRLVVLSLFEPVDLVHCHVREQQPR
jgi:hypothetical protein